MLAKPVVRLVLLMHVKELWRSSNTGSLLKLSLPELEIRVHGRLGGRSDARAWIDESCHRPVVLFPGPAAVPLTRDLALSDPKPLALLIPDGTWGQAKHMVKRIGGLADWPRVTLPQAPQSLRRPRRQVSADRMSTYEAVAQALGIVEDAEVRAAEMQAFYALFAARTLEMRGIFTSD